MANLGDVKKLLSLVGPVSGDWNKIQKIIGDKIAAEIFAMGVKKIAMKKVIAYFEGQIRRNITDGGKLAGKPFKELKESTIKMREKKRGKASTTPLIDIGDLRKSIKAQYIDEDRGFVGIKRGKVHSKTHDSLADIGEIHEFGAIVKEGFGKGITFEIPARPFIGPVLKKFRTKAGEVYANTLQRKIDE